MSLVGTTRKFENWKIVHMSPPHLGGELSTIVMYTYRRIYPEPDRSSAITPRRLGFRQFAAQCADVIRILLHKSSSTKVNLLY